MTIGLIETADRLAQLLTAGGEGLSDARHGDLQFEASVDIRRLERSEPPLEVWAVDGGQALVADARCLQVYATRAALACWRDGACVIEDEGALRLHLLGSGEERTALAALGSPVAPGAAVDVNLLRDWAEWEAVAAVVSEAPAGAVVLVDGDLQPDWRIPASWLADLLADAERRGVLLAGVTKHSSLARGGAPLLGSLELEAASLIGEREMWWAAVAYTRPDVGPGLQVLVARLDPDARFAFRVDLPQGVAPASALAAISAVSDDAGFPGYPYPLSVADRLAACPGWVRDDVWGQLEECFDRSGVPVAVRERAFTDRHRLMERA